MSAPATAGEAAASTAAPDATAATPAASAATAVTPAEPANFAAPSSGSGGGGGDGGGDVGGGGSGGGGGGGDDGGGGGGGEDAAAPPPSAAVPPPPPAPPRWVTHKRQFRTRAHSNPLSDGNFAPPACAAHARLDELIPLLAGGRPPRPVEWLDIGCGFGGLLMALAARHPATPMLGMEIRERVTEFCAARLAEARAKAARPTAGAAALSAAGATATPATPPPPPPPAYTNVGYVRTNAMKYLPNYIPRGTLTKLFFCYPDPHFKRKKHRQRIISGALLAEYAYVLAPGGVAYAVTDVYTLSAWMFTRFDAHPLFVRLTDAELAADSMVAFVRDHTDEAQRVERNGGTKFVGAWRRAPDPVDDADADAGANASADAAPGGGC